jgi:hypothetical protein
MKTAAPAVTENGVSAKVTQHVAIPAPNFSTVVFTLIGTAPYVQHKFSQKGREAYKASQEAGSKKKKGATREPKDFQANYVAAQYVSTEGWGGVPASCFRNAMISACRMVNFKMTHAKLSVFVEADGFDSEGTALVRITKGTPHYSEHIVRNATGVIDLRARPMWDAGWELKVRVKYDGDQFSLADVANLLSRAGYGGIGEGRPDSKSSAGLGWGTFRIAEDK